ncbi:hypothetical protein KCU67_g12911, partial [Aureobasidium melanogenum]
MEVAQEDGSQATVDPAIVDPAIETSSPVSVVQEESHSSIEQPEKENQAPVTDGEKEKNNEAPVDKSLQPEMPGSFD